MTLSFHLVRLALALAIATGLAACGGGDPEHCPAPTPAVAGKQAIPAQPCSEAAQ